MSHNEMLIMLMRLSVVHTYGSVDLMGAVVVSSSGACEMGQLGGASG